MPAGRPTRSGASWARTSCTGTPNDAKKSSRDTPRMGSGACPQGLEILSPINQVPTNGAQSKYYIPEGLLSFLGDNDTFRFVIDFITTMHDNMCRSLTCYETLFDLSSSTPRMFHGPVVWIRD